jgi:hypothetical protein
MVTINVYDSDSGDYVFNIPSHDRLYKVRVAQLVSQGLCCKVYDENGDVIYIMEAV